jgi:hypothetical protein
MKYMKNSDRSDAIELRWSGCRARFLSALIPGSGQLYAGKTFAAVIWLPAVVLGYLASPYLGLAGHFICILDSTERDSEFVFGEHTESRMSRRGAYVFGVVGVLLLLFVCWRIV